jgi:hypothetical protein
VTAATRLKEDFYWHGWVQLPFDPDVKAWAEGARAPALASIEDPAFQHWLVCEKTWFVGVDALPNDASGRVGQGADLPWATLEPLIGARPELHPGQVSAVFPGYPRPRDGESAAGFGYRMKRDAAHVDGIHAVGPERRRKLVECHAFILGVPLTSTEDGASPLVGWDGSHEIIRDRLRAALSDYPEAAWGEVDLTDTYQAARREVFEICPRREVPGQVGEMTLVHRLALHGVSPWRGGDSGPRVVAYFRPELESGFVGWLSQP